MTNIIENEITERDKIHCETALIAWKDLQTFFAAGKVVHVSEKLSLIEVAESFSKDDTAKFSNWMEQSLVSMIADEQALSWYEQEAEVWAVVIKPFVLVQGQVVKGPAN